MSDDLSSLEAWLGPVIRQIEPAQRSKLAREIARDLRRRQVANIKAQRNPDGTAFEPRKRLRARQGAIRRRAMFSRIRLPKYLKARGTANESVVGFASRVSRIARVHQYGLRDRVAPNGPIVDYPARRLLGYSRDDIEAIADRALQHIDRGAT